MPLSPGLGAIDGLQAKMTIHRKETDSLAEAIYSGAGIAHSVTR